MDRDGKEEYAGVWGVDRGFTDKRVSDYWPVWAECHVDRDGGGWDRTAVEGRSSAESLEMPGRTCTRRRALRQALVTARPRRGSAQVTSAGCGPCKDDGDGS